jgi:hypothetical protein
MARAVDSEPALVLEPEPEREQVRVPEPAPVSAQEPELALETETMWPRGRSERVLRFHSWIPQVTQSRGMLLIGKFVERWTR